MNAENEAIEKSINENKPTLSNEELKTKTNLSDIPFDPVTKKEKWGFYSYGFASEPFSSNALSLFIPIILETTASQAGFKLDQLTPCDIKEENYKCLVKIGSSFVDTNSYSLYVTSASVLLQALTFVSLGALADHGPLRKRMMITFALIGALFCTLFPVVQDPQLYYVIAIFYIICNVCFGASYIFYYSYIPILTNNDPRLLEKDDLNEEEYLKLKEKVSNQLSGNGFAIGYLGAVITLIITGVIVFLGGDDIILSQYSVMFVGIWWIFFTIMTAILMKSRPGPPLPAGENWLIYSWKVILKTIFKANKLPQLFLFLISWFMMSDGIGTITYVAILFAKAELNMDQTELLIISIIVPLCAAIGNLFWNFIQSKFNIKTRTMILILSFLFVFIPSYGLIGLSNLDWGLKHKSEIYVMACYLGLIMGGVMSFYRVQFSDIIPPNRENEFFSMYEITDKGSAWVGPLIVGAISDYTHNIRFGFWFLLTSFLVSFILMLFFDVNKARAQAKDFNL